MSILNRPSDGLFNMVIVLHKTLLHLGPMSKERLLSLVAPESAVADRAMATYSLRRWTELGLFEEVNSSVQISPANEFPRIKEKAEAALPAVMRRLVLHPNNNGNFWDAEGSRSADMTRALAWMLAQNVYKSEFAGIKEAEQEEIRQLGSGDRSVFRNDTRWNGFKAWASFLGFGYSRRDSFLIDPTIAVRETLGTLFEGSKELPIKTFLTRLAEQLPVLDGGEYRREMESQLSPPTWASPGETEVSSSLSRALLRLHESDVLRIEDRSDSPARMSLVLQGPGRRPVTHLLKGPAFT